MKTIFFFLILNIYLILNIIIVKYKNEKMKNKMCIYNNYNDLKTKTSNKSYF